jgi:DNA-binding transcriptional LysR family regulator
LEWDLLRTFEAVARLGSLTAASRTLGLSQSTVSRHLSKLEDEAGSPLLFRDSPVRLTDRGTALLAAVQPMVESALAAQSALQDTHEVSGLVTLATVGEMVRWLLAKRLAVFYKSYPHIRLQILVDNQIASLAAGEADVALRMTRPERGELVARKLNSESYGFFAACSLPLHAEIPWLGLAGSLASIPEQRFANRAFADRPPRLLVEDVESLGLVVQAGLGVAILPRGFASRLSGLVEVKPHDIGACDLGPIPTRDLWMVVHRSKQNVPKVRAVIDWLIDQVSEKQESLPKQTRG